MTQMEFRLATLVDLPSVENMLRRLANDIGDRFCAVQDDLARVLFGTNGTCFAIVARANGQDCGVALCSPVFSTMRGGGGIYVSDLWVSPEMRGQRLGPHLLSACSDRGRLLWDAIFMKLAVYDDNPQAQKFYESLGFTTVTGENVMVIALKDLTKRGKS